MESGQSKVGRNVVFIRLYLYYFTSILEETFVIVKYLLRANACWVFWVYKYHRINTYFALESVVSCTGEVCGKAGLWVISLTAGVRDRRVVFSELTGTGGGWGKERQNE